jgi:hypothetical protein
MDKICKWCNKLMSFSNSKSFGAHLTNCKMNPNKIERDNRSKKKKEKIINCTCGEKYTINISDYHFSIGKYKKYCSRKCANKRVHTIESRDRISKKLYKGGSTLYAINCKFCANSFQTRRKYQLFCCGSCVIRYRNLNEGLASKGGKASMYSQNNRSKNEILFSEYCIDNFNNVLTNEPIFNSWDADIIIEDIKVAILWNGIWHYKKITEKHSLEKVQKRDELKIAEIKNCGYIPYVIKDMGGFDEEKVKTEWEIFNIWLKNRDILII